MEGYWLISYIALWCVVLVMGVVILAHSRLLGVLHQRFGPANAKPLADGPALGERWGKLHGHTTRGDKWELRFPSAKPALLVFVSPLCQTCQELMPHAHDFAAAHPDVQFILVSSLDDPGMNYAYVNYQKLEKLHYYVGASLAAEMLISGTPYGVFLDRDGVVRRKGLVNHYEHLRSLIAPLETVNETSGTEASLITQQEGEHA